MDAVFSIALGIGLAAATGFRVFVPLLAAGLAAHAGWVPLSDGFAWLASTPALLTFGAAAAVETLAYYIPGVDHALDLLAGPIAVIAGVVVSASVMTELPPAVLWPVAIIAGGGMAGATKGTAALLRAQTSVSTAGLGNPIVSTAETTGAIGLSLLTLVLPLIACVAILLLLFWGGRKLKRAFVALRQRS
jgi:hypothetical protein